jgi:hypothetical protein
LHHFPRQGAPGGQYRPCLFPPLGFAKKGEAGPFIAEGNTEPGGSLPLNTNGGGLSYTHTGMYGMFASCGVLVLGKNPR